MYKRKRKSKQQEESREEATGEETSTTETVVQPSALHSPTSDEVLPSTEVAVDDEDAEQVQESA